ncbi:ATP-binding protein [Pelagicoccus mobilis]|uniref:histidine kinase n=1 Tax=Pelagicoccus mobilis TaxID=415221 RepID=A0A934VSZ7_9BACT|nr:ATP-binding protein [Pelagicoccus mobilis]MBK1879545.1 response regulator [Pelagicoccus mobilis]
MRRFAARLKQRFRSAPLSNKLLLIVLACSLLALSLITISSVVREYRMAAQREIESLNTLSDVLASSTDAALRFEDPTAATAILAALRNEKHITCGFILVEEGKTFAEYHRDEPCLPADALATNLEPDIFVVSKPIQVGGEQLGTLIIRSDNSDLRAQLITAITIKFAILILSLGASLLLAKRLLPIITDPVTELANLALRVSEERNYDLRALKRNNDEIGTLVDSINFMLSTVRQRDKSINETNRNLEALVADRTVKLVKAREKAEAALEAKSDFLSTMSHELRTPMNAIIGMSSVLQADGLDPNRARQIEIIQKSSSNLLNLINDLLDFSKIEANRLELENITYDLVSCVEESLDIAAAAKKNNRLVYCASFAPNLPSQLKGDVTRLRQILVNLLSNAFKFTKTGSVTIEVNHVPADRATGERMQISVRDTGIGIPEDRLNSIFESFTQASQSTSREYGGTGLGLTISYRLALAMGGNIQVESEVGTGSVFHLTLPIDRAQSLNTVVGKPLSVKKPLQVELRDLPPALDASLRITLTAWGCKLVGQRKEAGTEADLIVASALSEDEFRAVEKATRIHPNDRVIQLCHSDHAILIRKTTTASVLTLPIRIRDLRNTLLKYVETSESPLYDPTSPFASYQTEKWRNLRILLAEDNELSRNVFLHHMELIGIDIDTAYNGELACELALEHDYDIIFMDVRMPKLDGLKSARQIRDKQSENRKRPWIVGFTANTDPDALLEIEKSGMDDYLSKPAVIGDIADSVNRYFFERGEDPSSLKDA